MLWHWLNFTCFPGILPYHDKIIIQWLVCFLLCVKHSFAKLFAIEVISSDRSSHSQIIFEISVLKYFAIFTGKHLCWSLWKPEGLQLYQKQTPTHVFSCKYCNIFKDSFLYRTPPVNASEWNSEINWFSHFIPLENIKKPLIFFCFQGI